MNQEVDEVQQLLWVDPDSPPMIRNLGTMPPNLALREWVDNVMHTTHGKTTVRIPEKRHLNESLMERSKAKQASLEKIAEERASCIVCCGLT